MYSINLQESTLTVIKRFIIGVAIKISVTFRLCHLSSQGYGITQNGGIIFFVHFLWANFFPLSSVVSREESSHQTKTSDGAVSLTGTWQTCNQGVK